MAVVNAEQAAVLRSGSSLHEAFIIFFNNTDRTVKLHWVDYHGHNTYYATVIPKGHIKVNTFQSHPWKFYDEKTGERMQVQHKYLYWPQPCMRALTSERFMAVRRPVSIHFPVRSLRDNCLWMVLKQLIKRYGYKNAKVVEQLSLPRTVQVELMRMMRFSHVYNTLHEEGRSL